MNGYGCNFCDEPRPVAWLVTSLANGETLAVCAEDFPVALIPLLAGELGLDPQRFYDTVKRFTDREAARQVKTAAAQLVAQRAAADADEAAAAAQEVADDREAADTDPANMTDAEYYGPGHVDDGQADEDEERGIFHGAHEEAL